VSKLLTKKHESPPHGYRLHRSLKMSSCCVTGSQNRRSHGSKLFIKFYRIPATTARQQKLRQLWLNALYASLHNRLGKNYLLASIAKQTGGNHSSVILLCKTGIVIIHKAILPSAVLHPLSESIRVGQPSPLGQCLLSPRNTCSPAE